MSTKLQAELSLENEKGQDVVAYPFIEAEHVTLANGMNIETMLAQDVSMPTVTHENLSFKVGVGDQDVSSAIVDSSVAEMTIKGQTYQNILPEPSTHVLSNNEEMFKVNEGLDPIVEIVDGVSRSAVLKGQTLVNVLSYTKVGGNVPLVKNGNVIEVESTTESTWRSVDIDFTYLKPNTKYIVTWDSITFSNTNFVPTSSLISVRLKTDNTQIAGWDSSRNYIIATVPSDTSDVKLRVHASQGTAMINKTTVKGLKVLEYQEGMENWDIPYFEGMASCRMPILCTTGKNLFDGVLSQGWIGDATGESNMGRDGLHGSQYIKVNPSSVYTFKAQSMPNGVTANSRFYFYDRNKTYLNIYRDGETSGSAKLINVPSDAYYMRFRFHCPNQTVTPEQFASCTIQIEEGSTATSYEPHRTNTLSCQLAPLNQSMFEQGTFAEATPPNTQTYEQIKLDSNHLYDIRIRTKGTYKVAQGATYEVQLNDGYGIFVCYCKNGLYSATINRWLDGTRFTFTVPTDCDEMFFALRKTDNTTITPSDYPLIGLKIHQEVVLRSLSNEVKDTLNLNTGEYVRCVGELALTGSESYSLQTVNTPNHTRVLTVINNINTWLGGHCNKLMLRTTEEHGEYEYIYLQNKSTEADQANLYIQIENSKLSGTTVDAVKSYLQTLYNNGTPLTVQYGLATPIIEKIDLSSSGNWEKVVLDGSEGWQCDANSETGAQVYIPRHQGQKFFNSLKSQDGGGLLHDLKNTNYFKVFSIGNNYGMTVVIDKTNFPINIGTNITLGEVRELWKQWLSQNPITVWYQTETHQYSTQVKQPIFFADGHIIQSSGADNSLIPTLDYQVKTSNSYVMDLMKANTRYTMKAKSASGTFTIDGTSYGAGTNGTFTTPSSMTNKFLVMSNNANEEVMILEGDVVSKTIPYFKGIKSAFEGEDEISILSTGKNLYPYGDVSFTPTEHNWYDAVGTIKMYGDIGSKSKCRFQLKKGTYYFSHGVLENIEASQLVDDNENIFLKTWSGAFTLTEDAFLTLRIKPKQETYTEPVLLTNIQIAEKTTATTYEPYKSNNTKISLSCGVNEVSEPLAIPTEFGKWVVDTGAPEATNETRRSIRAMNIPENTSEICFYNNDVLRAVNFHALDENENYVEYIHSADGRVAIKDGYKKFKIHLGTNNSSNLSCRFTTINDKALRSLPNGVKDEIVLDRENNKAKIIQRIGSTVFNGGERIKLVSSVSTSTHLYFDFVEGFVGARNQSLATCDRFTYVGGLYGTHQNVEGVCIGSNKWGSIRISASRLNTPDVEGFKAWLSRNPVTVYYELETPVIKTVDLSGYPYVYKDGHIFLNGEIIPITEITYSINQEHQIEANNQDLIRHEQDIDFLYKLIKQYVIVDFQSTYLSLRNQ